MGPSVPAPNATGPQNTPPPATRDARGYNASRAAGVPRPDPVHREQPARWQGRREVPGSPPPALSTQLSNDPPLSYFQARRPPHPRGGGHLSAAAGFNFPPRCQPQTCPGTCPRSARQARAASPAFLPPAPARTAPGASAGASTPRPSVPDDAGGGQRSGPAPAEAADAAGRGRTPGQSCTSPWPTTNDKGNGRARGAELLLLPAATGSLAPHAPRGLWSTR